MNNKDYWIETNKELPEPYVDVLILYPKLYANLRKDRESSFICRLERAIGYMDREGLWTAISRKIEILEHNPPKYWHPIPPYDDEEYIPDKKRDRVSPNTNKPRTARG